MAKFVVADGIDNYLAELDGLNKDTEPMIKRAVYVGAKVVADEIKKEIESLPEEKPRFATPENPLNGINKAQKQGLLMGMGISPMKVSDGMVHVKVGFDGYNNITTKKYPKGQPNALIARSLESGTSFQKRNAFVTRAVRRSEKKAEEAMNEEFEKELENKFR